jgi:hypothetical protein
MSFNGQVNMFFGKIITYTCDLHLKLNILNTLMILRMNILPYSFFFQNFKTLKFFYDFIFHKIHPIKMYFHWGGGMFLLYKQFEIKLYDFMHSFLIPFKKKCNLDI